MARQAWIAWAYLGLVVTLAVLKQLGVVEWSWWLVALPVWGPLALALACLVAAIAFSLLLAAF